MASPRACERCKREVYWFVNFAKRRVPFDLDGRAHFGTCGTASTGVSELGGGAVEGQDEARLDDESEYMDKLPL